MIPKGSFIVFFSLSLALVLVFYVEIIWVESTYGKKRVETESIIKSALNSPKIKEEIEMQQRAWGKGIKSIRPEKLNEAEKKWRSLFNGLLEKRSLWGVDYEFAILSQGVFSTQPNQVFFKTLGYDRYKENPNYTSAKTFLLSDFRKDPLSYSTSDKNYEVLFLYKVDPSLLWWNIRHFIIISLAILALALFCFFASFQSLQKRRHFERLKDDFLNGMTHELNTPIAVIQLAAQYLQKREKTIDGAFLKETTDVILYETKRMNQLVGSILAVARLRQSKFKLDKEIVSIGDILREVLKSFSLHLKGIDHRIDLDLPPSSEDHIEGDRFHLTHMLSNLVDNAIKYRRKDVPFRLSIKIVAEGKTLLILISDNGIGIEEKELRNIFDRFFRSENSTKDTATGFGLGLAYVSDIIRLHKGKMEAKSSPDEGTTFAISFKRAKNSAGA